MPNIAYAKDSQVVTKSPGAKKIIWEGKEIDTNTKEVRVYIKDIFRIFYYTSGVNKVSMRDADANNIPDYVEDVSKQFWATQYLFCQIYGFRSPLDSPRYKGVESIDVYILHRNSIKESLGLAVTEPGPAPLKKEGSLALILYISKGLDFRHSTTVTHEYFHLIQNGMSKISNKWYLEGLARWSENGLMKKRVFIEPRWNFNRLIASREGLIRIQTSSYNAGKLFWHPLTALLGKEKKIKLADDDVLLNLKYSNGTAVLQDTHFAGASLIRDFLLELSKEDAKLEKKFKYTDWNIQQSRHVQNSSYILNALKRALLKAKNP